MRGDFDPIVLAIKLATQPITSPLAFIDGDSYLGAISKLQLVKTLYEELEDICYYGVVSPVRRRIAATKGQVDNG